MVRRRSFLLLPSLARAASKDLTNRLLQAINSIEVIDTHEHILPESDRVKQRVEVFTLASHYLIDDMTSSGLPAADRELLLKEGASIDAKWEVFEPYWKFVRNTGYAEAFRIAVRDIYGVEEISTGTVSRLNDAVVAKNRAGLYREVLKSKSRIRYGINDEYWVSAPRAVDREFFLLARKFDWFVTPVTRAGLQRLEKLSDSSITNVAGLKAALEKHFLLALKVGMVTVKSTIAYERDLFFEETSAAAAAAEFEKLSVTDSAPTRDGRRPFRALSNHMFHHLVELAQKHNVPMQIHTGLQAGNGNYVANTRPSQLTNLLLKYPKVRFDIFHIGFPYWQEVTVLAKEFPNAFADFCWMHIVSPSASRTALHQMLDSVPANKIFAFGGDYRYPELSYGHLVIARRNVSQVMAERVEAGACTEEEALQTAKWLFHDNAAAVFLRT